MARWSRVISDSERNQWFINNRSVAWCRDLSLYSFPPPPLSLSLSPAFRFIPEATVLNSYYVGAEWKPACQRQEGG